MTKFKRYVCRQFSLYVSGKKTAKQNEVGEIWKGFSRLKVLVNRYTFAGNLLMFPAKAGKDKKDSPIFIMTGYKR